MQTEKKNTALSGIFQLFPILKFLKNAWMVIAAGAGLGFLIGIIYLVLQSPVYQATVMFSMAQIPSHRDFSAFSNIEEPVFLIERLKIPSSYSPQAITACKNPHEDMSPESMWHLVSAGIPRAVASVVFLRIRRDSPEISERCANAIFKMIAKQQDDLIRPIEEDLRRTLRSLQEQREELRKELLAAEKQDNYETLFFAKRDELIGLNQKIFELNRGVEKIAQTSLVAPIYVSPKPILPQRELVFAAAIIFGIFSGLLVAGFRELTRWQNNLTGIQN